MTRLGERGPIVLVGAGLAGSMLAVYLARQGHDVQLYESRADLRRVDVDAGRSINLALATRGLVPLRELGLAEAVDAITVPMAGRMIHAEGASLDGMDGAVSFQPYGNRPDEVIHSVSRQDLTALLLDAAEETGRVELHFEQWCHRVDTNDRVLHFSPYGEPDRITEVPFGTVFGCDGAGSEIRDDVSRAIGGSVSSEPLDHSYKELTLPPKPGGGFQLDPGGLHIWPRGELMLIALANPEGDFTVTLFMPTTSAGPGSHSFDDLRTAADVDGFFERFFPDVPPLIDDLADQFLTNPTGSLATVRVDGWSLDDRAVLIGDAAHAIVPFHGQGMNLAMESVRLLDGHLRRHPDDIAAAFAAFEADRKPDADAIADMALDNYVEMRADVVDPDYLLRRELALELERLHPEQFVPRYGMVMFTTMPYAAVRDRASRQQDVLTALTDGVDPTVDGIESIDLGRAAPLIDRLGPLPDWK
jgi:kynurenine 3-monooxygenase